MREEHAPGVLSLVGGKIEETGIAYDVLENSLKREIYEEVGVKIENEIKNVHSSSFITGKGNLCENLFLK